MNGPQSLRPGDGDVSGSLPLLEAPLADSGLDEEAAVRLVESVVCQPLADEWVSRALKWIDDGVWSDSISRALVSISQDLSFSPLTRHLAWSAVMPDSVGQVAGSAVVELSKTDGPDAWFAELADGRMVVVKRAAGWKNPPGTARLEAWAYAACAKQEIRVPRVLALSGHPEFVVIERLAGRPLSDGANCDARQVRTIWSHAGADLRRMHEISLSGFGPLVGGESEPHGLSSTWSPFVEYARAEGIPWLVDAGYLERTVGDRLLNRFDTAVPLVRRLPVGRLLHGDLQSGHVFQNDGDYTGIIDFGAAQAGDPRWDLARVLLWDGDAALDALLDGYGDDVVTEEDRELLLPLYLFAFVVKVAVGHQPHYIRLLLDRSRYQLLL
jgi:aminoglycoside phosphotransferase